MYAREKNAIHETIFSVNNNNITFWNFDGTPKWRMIKRFTGRVPRVLSKSKKKTQSPNILRLHSDKKT